MGWFPSRAPHCGSESEERTSRDRSGEKRVNTSIELLTVLDLFYRWKEKTKISNLIGKSTCKSVRLNICSHSQRKMCHTILFRFFFNSIENTNFSIKSIFAQNVSLCELFPGNPWPPFFWCITRISRKVGEKHWERKKAAFTIQRITCSLRALSIPLTNSTA